MGANEYSVAEARDQLSRLIDRALRGEGVVITRHGRPVVQLRPLTPEPRPATAADVEWLRARRVGPPRKETAGTLVSRMRDEAER